MGVKLEAQQKCPDSLDYVQNREKVTEMITDRFKSPWLWHDFTYFNILPVGRHFVKLVNSLHKFTSNVIERRWEEIRDDVDGMILQKKQSFLDLLLLAKEANNLSFEDVREEVDTFMFEGENFLFFSFYLLL